ncbi:PilS N terminal [Thalassospira xiamenensis M-5 = DSM 17429]|uniref:Bundlin n=1 Tax=Thalassospira xiamenensis M-5 = DSM 17429 TaxID=1123366 RepID=A0AB72UJS4_9PROT|nr:type 4 pilus major pilin [Thalassospira xiamenensis]AJD54414.1 Bundlin [Thalassospira xiamenensis M-5 = DSM 17429]SIT22008.1 PilS N terminal [Thalassospira xiamenensis M-5 = DSM 17429]
MLVLKRPPLTKPIIQSEAKVDLRRAGWGIGSFLLAAILAAGVAAFGYDQFKRAETNGQVTQFRSQMTELPANITSIYGSQRNYAGLSATILINNGAIPEKWQNAAGDGIVHVGGGAVGVAPATTTQAGFVLRFTDLPQAMCRSAVADGLGAVGYQGSATASGVVDEDTIGPSASATLCANNLNQITATFLK